MHEVFWEYSREEGIQILGYRYVARRKVFLNLENKPFHNSNYIQMLNVIDIILRFMQ